MDTFNLNIDPSVFNEFIDESNDMLESLDQQFVKLEQFPNDQDIISCIFRPIHSIKGNAAFFGLNKIKKLAHELETLLDKVRKNVLPVTTPLIDVILHGADTLRLYFENVRNQQPEVSDEVEFNKIIENIQKHAVPESESVDVQWAHLFEKMNELTKLINTEDNILLNQFQLFAAILENIHPNQTKQHPPLPEHAQNILDIIELHPDSKLSTDEENTIEKSLNKLKTEHELCVTHIDEILCMFTTFMTTTGFDPLLAELIQTKIYYLRDTEKFNNNTKQVTETTDEGSTNSEQNEIQKTSQSEIPKNTEKHESDKTMRVSESHIDTFLEYVGELLVVGDMFKHLEKSLATGKSTHLMLPNFRRANDTFSQLSNSLQTSIMSIRKIPVKALLQKVPRLVRDIASKLDKKINVEIHGDNISIDKSIIDMLDAPLTHMVRNAADHGIETTADRIKAGKSPDGNVSVTVSESDTSIVMVISDDGGGLNGKAIKEKAIKMGILKPETKLSEQEQQELIFASGLSTASEITDISGRGVGMDVVRRFIEDAGGTVGVTSTHGKGSDFNISLPKTVTTQIMFGYLVSISGERYVLPMSKVHETARINKNEIKTIIGQRKCIIRHDNILRIIPLRQLLGLNLNPKAENDEQQIIVTIVNKKDEFAICVDEVLGVQQVVLRKIEGINSTDGLITGGALMGDGSISLILDTEIIESINPRKIHNEIQGTPKEYVA